MLLPSFQKLEFLNYHENLYDFHMDFSSKAEQTSWGTLAVEISDNIFGSLFRLLIPNLVPLLSKYPIHCSLSSYTR